MSKTKGNTKPLKPYSVLLQYPHYVWDNDETAETFYAHVMATDVMQAVGAAQAQALKFNEWGADGTNYEDMRPDEFDSLLVIAGHHEGAGE